MVGKLRKYIKKYWLTHISPEEHSIFELSISTNNGTESYHSKLKATIRTSHPRIWSFLSQLNDIIMDTDNDIGEISRARKLNYVHNDEERITFKERFRNGEYTPWQFFQAMSNTIGCKKFKQIALSDSKDNEDELEDGVINMGGSNCTVCLGPRILTWLLMPYRHATFCTDCSQQLIDLGQSCPICRSNIDERLVIYIN